MNHNIKSMIAMLVLTVAITLVTGCSSISSSDRDFFYRGWIDPCAATDQRAPIAPTPNPVQSAQLWAAMMATAFPDGREARDERSMNDKGEIQTTGNEGLLEDTRTGFAKAERKQ